MKRHKPYGRGTLRLTSFRNGSEIQYAVEAWYKRHIVHRMVYRNIEQAEAAYELTIDQLDKSIFEEHLISNKITRVALAILETRKQNKPIGGSTNGNS